MTRMIVHLVGLGLVGLVALGCGDDKGGRSDGDVASEVAGDDTSAEDVDTAPDEADAAADTQADTVPDEADAVADTTPDSEPADTGDATDTSTPTPSTLAEVKARGLLRCGVNAKLTGFSVLEGQQASGFDVDFCRAVAAAVLGDAGALELVPLTSAERFAALGSGAIDVLIRNTTWTQGRDAVFDFGPTTFYDGQKLIGATARFDAASTVADIGGTTVCAITATTSFENIRNAATQAGVSVTWQEVADNAEGVAKLLDGTCDLFTADESALVSLRYDLGAAGQDLVIFPGTPISKEPLGPVYRAGDSAWGDVVSWTVYAMIIADEKGITSEDVATSWSSDAQSTALFGGAGERQTMMGLSADAFRQVIAQVGNYGEVFARNLTPVGFARAGTLNAPFGAGAGLIFAPPSGGSVPGDGALTPVTVRTLDEVRARGTVRCGVNGGLTGFSVLDGGTASGFDVAFCHALGAAVLGDGQAVELVPLTSAQRFSALADGSIDVLIRNTTWTQGRDLVFDFGPTTFYDGQKLVGRSPTYRVDSTLAEIEGTTVCAITATTNLENIRNAASAAGVTITIEEVATNAEGVDKLLAGTCDLFTTDESALVSLRHDLGTEGADLVIFPGKPISKEPLGPVYRANDSAWGDVVTWTVFAMITADEKGITSANIDTAWDDDARTTALFGGEGERQTAMGLSADAFRKVISQVGSYGEVFAQNLGLVGFSRVATLNAGFGASGGLIFAPPVGGTVPQ